MRHRPGPAGGVQIIVVHSLAIGDHQRIAEKIGAVHIQPPIGHVDPALSYRFDESRAELFSGHFFEAGDQAAIGGHIDLHRGDRAGQAVSAHGHAENVGVLLARAGDQFAIGQHHVETTYRGPHRPQPDRPAMGVDAEGGGDAEIVVRLHDFGAEPDRIERVDDLGPARTRVYPHGACRGVGFDPAIVIGDGMAAARDRLPAHRMTRGADIDGAAFGGGSGNLGTDRLDQAGTGVFAQSNMAKDRSFGQAAGIVQHIRSTGRADACGAVQHRVRGREPPGGPPANHSPASQEKCTSGEVFHHILTCPCLQ